MRKESTCNGCTLTAQNLRRTQTNTSGFVKKQSGSPVTVCLQKSQNYTTGRDDVEPVRYGLLYPVDGKINENKKYERYNRIVRRGRHDFEKMLFYGGVRGSCTPFQTLYLCFSTMKRGCESRSFSTPFFSQPL